MSERGDPPTDDAPAPTRRGAFWLKLALITAAVYLIGALAMFAWLHVETLAAIDARLKHIHPWTTALHLGVIATIALAWAPLMRLISRRQRFDDAQHARLLTFRWPVVTLLMGFHLLTKQLPFWVERFT